jgi:hypothetical protein
MRHRARVAPLIGALAAAAIAAGAGDASIGSGARLPAAVTIQNAYVDDFTPTPFSATGRVCASGTAETTSSRVLSSGADYLNLYVTKRFTCEDGTGTFDLALAVHLTLDPFTDVYAWAVTGGTGTYAHLRAFGTGVGERRPDGTVVDTYRGAVVGGS